MRKFLSIVFLGGLTAVTVLALFQIGRVRQLRSAIASNEQRVTGLKCELHSVKLNNEEVAHSGHAIEGECLALQKQIDALTNQTPVASEPPKNKPQSMQNWTDQGMKLTGQNAEYQKVYLDWVRLGYGPRYARLYNSLGLTPDQIQQLECLVQAREQAVWDVLGAAQNQGLTYKDSGVPEMINKAQNEATEKIKELLGAKGYDEFVKASGSTVGSSVTRDIVSVSLYSDAPITVEQADKLEALINGCRKKNLRSGKVEWDKVFAQAGVILTPAQVALFKSQRESSRLNEEMQAIEQKAAAVQ